MITARLKPSYVTLHVFSCYCGILAHLHLNTHSGMDSGGVSVTQDINTA